MNWEWLVSSLKNSVNIAATILGGLTVWVLSQLKNIKDIQKQSLENTALRVSLIEKLLIIDKEQREEKEKLDQLIYDYLDLIGTANKDKANNLRHQIHDQLRKGFIGSYYRYYKIARWIERDSGARELARLELLPFLETCVAYITYINRDDVLKWLNSSFLPFHLTTFDFALSYVESNTYFWQLRTKQRIKRCKAVFRRYSAI